MCFDWGGAAVRDIVVDREEVVFGWGREGDHRADALGSDRVACGGVEFDPHPVRVFRCGLWGDEVVSEVRDGFFVVEENRVDVSIVVCVEAHESAALRDIADVAVFSGFGEAGRVSVVEEECGGVVPETTCGESVVFEDVFVSIVVEVVNECAPSPVSQVCPCGWAVVVEGAV